MTPRPQLKSGSILMIVIVAAVLIGTTLVTIRVRRIQAAEEAKRAVPRVATLPTEDAPFVTAGAQLARDDRSAALASLERAYLENDPRLSTLETDPRWNTLRGEPQFEALLERIRDASRANAVTRSAKPSLEPESRR